MNIFLTEVYESKPKITPQVSQRTASAAHQTNISSESVEMTSRVTLVKFQLLVNPFVPVCI